MKRTAEEDILRREANALQIKSYQEKEDKARGDPPIIPQVPGDKNEANGEG